MNSGRKLQRIPLSKKIKKTLNHLCKRKSLNILKYFEVPGVCSKRSVESFVKDQLMMNFKIYEKLPRLGLHAGILAVSFTRTRIYDLSRLGPKYLPTERYQELNFIRVKHSKHISSHYHSTEKPFQVERYSKFLKKQYLHFCLPVISLNCPQKTSCPPKLMASKPKNRGNFRFWIGPVEMNWGL